MRKRCRLLLWCAVLAGAGFVQACGAGSYSGTVVSVTDGDTLKVLDAGQHRHVVRLAGIDAPESSQPYGQQSRQSLASLVLGREVRVDTGKHDRYGREIGKVLRPDMDVDLEQIRRGLAWHYKAYAREQSPQDRLDYARAEQEARSGHVGLWTDLNAEPPWQYRHQRRP